MVSSRWRKRNPTAEYDVRRMNPRGWTAMEPSTESEELDLEQAADRSDNNDAAHEGPEGF